MAFLILILFVIVCGTLAIVIDRRLEKVKQARLAAAPSTEIPAPATILANFNQQFAQQSEGVRQWLAKRLNRDLPEQFRIWSQKALPDPEVKQWFKGLPDEGLAALTKHVERFCHEMGIDLNEVVYGHLEHNPLVEMAVAQVVENYCRACVRAVSKQDEIVAWRAVCAYERNPSSRSNQAFGELLFIRINEAKLIAGDPTEYQAASNKERYSLTSLAIQLAARKDNHRFNEVLKAVVQEHKGRMISHAIPAAPSNRTAPPNQNGAVPTQIPA